MRSRIQIQVRKRRRVVSACRRCCCRFALLALGPEASAFAGGLATIGTSAARESLPLLRLRTIRGGDVNSQRMKTNLSDNININDKSPSEHRRPRQERGMSWALAIAYFTVMGAKCALPSVLALLESPETGLDFPTSAPPNQLMARQLTTATLAICAGKLVLGPLIDHIGGIKSLQIALSLLTLFLGTIACNQSFGVFAVSYILVDFVFSSCWPACINAIHQTFEQREWAPQIARLAAAARMGNASAFWCFGSLLHWLSSTSMRQTWRPIFGLAAALQLVPLVLVTWFGNRSSSNNNKKTYHSTEKPSIRESVAILQDEARTLDFWLHLINRSVLMVFASFLLFVPKLQSQVYQTSAASAAQTGSYYAIGCWLSVTLLGPVVYAPQRTRRQKLLALLGLLGTAVACSVGQLGHMSGWWQFSATASMVSMFGWGLAFAVPFYIPPSLYALQHGQSSATIADVFDIGGFALLTGFNGYVAGLDHSNPAAWIGAFRLTTACAVVSYLTLSMAAWRETSEARMPSRKS